MKIKTRFFSICFLVILTTGGLFSQNKLTGTVFDDLTNNPLPGANILVDETNYGAAADADGNYVIEDVPDGNYTVTAGYIGYKSSSNDVNVTGGSVKVNFSLNVDPLRSEEVVVTGAASRTTKATSEIAVQRISASELTG